MTHTTNDKPGPELDDLIEENVFRRTEKSFDGIYRNRWRFKRRADEEDHDCWYVAQPYSTTWSGMQLVVEEMQRRGLSVSLTNHSREFIWHCHIRGELPDVLGGAWSTTAPHAVCLAALEGQRDE